jgi:hypothetical protein
MGASAQRSIQPFTIHISRPVARGLPYKGLASQEDTHFQFTFVAFLGFRSAIPRDRAFFCPHDTRRSGIAAAIPEERK